MIRQFLSALAIFTSFSGLAQTHIVPAHIGFVYPLSTNGRFAPQCTNAFSLHALSGISKNERALCISGLAGIVRDSGTGLMVSGLVSTVGSNFTGLQMSGLVNHTGNALGLQVSGLVNISDSLLGLQLSGFTSIAGNAHGAQISGFTGIAGDINAQVSGFYSQARTVDGAQISGFCNLAGDVKGVQIAGFINKAKKVGGAQLAGFINIADSSEHPVGIINIIGNGEKSFGIMADNNGYTTTTFRSGSKTMYGLLGVGINVSKPDLYYEMQAGIGAQLRLSKNFRLKGEIFSAHITDFRSAWSMRSGVRLLPALKLGIVEVFAGPAFNASIFETKNVTAFHNNNPFWTHTYRSTSYEGYLSGVAGIQVLF